MSINLKDYLKRKRSSLKKFILQSNIKSYEEILDYCKRRGCTPITEEEFSLVVLQEEEVKPKIEEAKEASSNEEKPARPKRRKRRTKVSRPAQDSQEEGATNKSVKDA